MTWEIYYNNQLVGSGIDDATKAHMVDMMETAASNGRIAWLVGTALDGDKVELAYTPGVPVWFMQEQA